MAMKLEMLIFTETPILLTSDQELLNTQWAADVRSPLEFFGRSFETSGQTAANTLASDETIIMDYSYYQGRIDRVYLSKDAFPNYLRNSIR